VYAQSVTNNKGQTSVRCSSWYYANGLETDYKDSLTRLLICASRSLELFASETAPETETILSPLVGSPRQIEA